jgi:hypothetical protein
MLWYQECSGGIGCKDSRRVVFQFDHVGCGAITRGTNKAQLPHQPRHRSSWSPVRLLTSKYLASPGI